jgi:hypothetical protein
MEESIIASLEAIARDLPRRTEQDQENLNQYSQCPGQDSNEAPRGRS